MPTFENQVKEAQKLLFSAIYKLNEACDSAPSISMADSVYFISRKLEDLATDTSGAYQSLTLVIKELENLNKK